MNRLAQLPEGDNLCAYCRRPWFGFVDFCPFCGRKPRFGAGVPIDNLPVLDEDIVVEQDRTVPAQLRTAASPLLFKTVPAGVIALVLLWMVVAKLLASRTGEEASPYPPAATSAIAAPARSPLASAARTSTSPCSAAHQAAGLCTLQE